MSVYLSGVKIKRLAVSFSIHLYLFLIKLKCSSMHVFLVKDDGVCDFHLGARPHSVLSVLFTFLKLSGDL